MLRSVVVLVMALTQSSAFLRPQAGVSPFRTRSSRLTAKSDQEKYAFMERQYGRGAADDWKLGRERDKKSYNSDRMRKLGAKEGEEYDLESALSANTDDTITKIIAGSLILSIIIGLWFGVISPMLFPAEFTAADGTTYVKVAGSFVER